MIKVDGSGFSNVIQYAVIEKQCTLHAYKDVNYENLIGKWKGSVIRNQDHEMNEKLESRKISSFKCSCEEQTCEDQFSLDKGVPNGCAKPRCDVATFDIVDEWKDMVCIP